MPPLPGGDSIPVPVVPPAFASPDEEAEDDE